MKNHHHIIIKYHNRKMLMTLDIITLFQVVLDCYGDTTVIEFQPMSEIERNDSSNLIEGITAVTNRFWIFESDTEGNLYKRRKDLESEIVEKGQK